MAFDPTRPLTAAPAPARPAPATLLQRLEAFFGVAARPTGSSSVLGADRLARSPGTAPLVGLAPAALSAVARLTRPGAATGLDVGAWQALAAAWASAGPAQRSALALRLKAGNVGVEPSSDGRYVAFVSAGLRVTAEPASGKLRRAANGRTDCFLGNTLAETLVTQGAQVTVSFADGRRQVWSTETGQGTDQDGQPLAPVMAAPVEGEAPRRAWAAPLEDRLHEPVWRDGNPLAAYEPAYDQAVLAAGDTVETPSDPTAKAADQFNCHSFATTAGQGDLFDPFTREADPHWINNPLYQLSTGPYAQLAPSQAVHPGDLVVYKDGATVTHTGVVQAVDADGNPTQVESKFGILGTFVHAPFDVPPDYGQPSVFFRPNPST